MNHLEVKPATRRKRSIKTEPVNVEKKPRKKPGPKPKPKVSPKLTKITQNPIISVAETCQNCLRDHEFLDNGIDGICHYLIKNTLISLNTYCRFYLRDNDALSKMKQRIYERGSNETRLESS